MKVRRSTHSKYTRYKQVEYSGLLEGFIASWILHIAMFIIASTTTIFYPATADTELISFDLFFASTGSQMSAPAVVTTAQNLSMEHPRDHLYEVDEEEIRPSGDELYLHAEKPEISQTKKKSPLKAKVEHPVPEDSKIINETTLPAQTIILPAENSGTIENRQLSAEIPEKSDKPEFEMQTKSPIQSEAEKKAVELEKLRRLQEKELAEARTREEEMKRATETAKAAEQGREALENAARARISAGKIAKAKTARVQQAKINEKRKVATVAITEGSSQATTGTAQAKPVNTDSSNIGKELLKKQSEQKGLAIPPVKGDIRLIVTSGDEIEVKVLFISYPKARHGKAITKNEARGEQKITPVTVRTAQNTHESVIEHSKEGVYAFSAENKGGKPVAGKFSLKLFESKEKPLATVEISGQTEIARLLMPEGILWNDDTAFSGNIEDSESVTKFNSETGLVWKEYRR